MSFFWIAMLCAAVIFLVSTAVTILLIWKAPNFQEEDPMWRSTDVLGRDSQEHQARAHWTQFRNRSRLQNSNNNPKAASRDR